MKLFQAKIHVVSGLFVFIIGALLTATTGLILTNFFFKQSTVVTREGVQLALIAGAIWAVGQLMFFLTLSKNPPLSVVLPILVAGIGIGGVLAGVLYFQEALTPQRIFAIAIVLIGSIILARS